MGFYGKGGSAQLKRFRKIADQIDEWKKLRYARRGGLGKAANKKLSRFEEFLLNDWDAKMISKITGKPPWEGTQGLFQKPGQWILKE